MQKDIIAMIQSLRELCAELRPPVLDNLGFVGAIQSLIEEFKKRTKIPIKFNLDINREEGLVDSVELCTYRILQEALLNIQKHAQAHQVEVSLRYVETGLDLIVVDDGKGFILPDTLELYTLQNHFGLAGMKERANLIGGNLEIYTIPGHGCQLLLQIPLISENIMAPE